MKSTNREFDFIKRCVSTVIGQFYQKSQMFGNVHQRNLALLPPCEMLIAMNTVVIWWDNPTRHQSCVTLSQGLLHMFRKGVHAFIF